MVLFFKCLIIFFSKSVWHLAQVAFVAQVVFCFFSKSVWHLAQVAFVAQVVFCLCRSCRKCQMPFD